VLLARRPVAEVPIIRQVHKQVCSFTGELAHEVREGRFVADKRGDIPAVDREDNDPASGSEISGFT
jgi:hypothetical protein